MMNTSFALRSEANNRFPQLLFQRDSHARSRVPVLDPIKTRCGKPLLRREPSIVFLVGPWENAVRTTNEGQKKRPAESSSRLDSLGLLSAQARRGDNVKCREHSFVYSDTTTSFLRCQVAIDISPSLPSYSPPIHSEILFLSLFFSELRNQSGLRSPIVCRG